MSKKIDGLVFTSFSGDEAERRKEAMGITMHEMCSADYKNMRYITSVDIEGCPIKYILWDSDERCPVFVWETLFKISEFPGGVSSKEELVSKLDDVMEWAQSFELSTDEVSEVVAALLESVPDGHFVPGVKKLGLEICEAQVINCEDYGGYLVATVIRSGVVRHSERDEKLAEVVDNYITATILHQDLLFLGDGEES